MTSICLQTRSLDVASAARVLPMRHCVGVMMVNPSGLIWLGRRRPKWYTDEAACIWQMPQGGIMAGERAIDAAYRELAEETGTRRVEMLGEIAQPLSFELPPHLVGIALKGRYRGQILRWYALRFLGSDREIDIRRHKRHKAEFCDWRWAQPDEVASEVPTYKRQMYRSVVASFSALIDGAAKVRSA